MQKIVKAQLESIFGAGNDVRQEFRHELHALDMELHGEEFTVQEHNGFYFFGTIDERGFVRSELSPVLKSKTEMSAYILACANGAFMLRLHQVFHK